MKKTIKSVVLRNECDIRFGKYDPEQLHKKLHEDIIAALNDSVDKMDVKVDKGYLSIAVETHFIMQEEK
jgi:hypothetical protein